MFAFRVNAEIEQSPHQDNGGLFVGPATTQNLVVKFDGEICGGVSVENVSDDFPQQKKLENLLPNFAGSSPPISPKTSPTSLWKSLVLMFGEFSELLHILQETTLGTGKRGHYERSLFTEASLESPEPLYIL